MSNQGGPNYGPADATDAPRKAFTATALSGHFWQKGLKPGKRPSSWYSWTV